MTQKQLEKILILHKKWLDFKEGGVRADLSNANLSRADLFNANLFKANLIGINLFNANLSYADLSKANLSKANLSYAYLSNANLFRADLSYADLSNANLFNANLFKANLIGINLFNANLFRADLSYADLFNANLSKANLIGINLFNANLISTCLNPENKPNSDVKSFKKAKGFVIGYRTRKAGHIDIYRDGRYYSADFFSTSDTECHPGLYLWPDREKAKAFSPNKELIEVRTKAEDVHKAGTKWRCRWFQVVGKV